MISLHLQDLATGALLHDIGLLQVPPTILQRIHDTSTTLSEQNRRTYESHARAGAILLERQTRLLPGGRTNRGGASCLLEWKRISRGNQRRIHFGYDTDRDGHGPV